MKVESGEKGRKAEREHCLPFSDFGFFGKLVPETNLSAFRAFGLSWLILILLLLVFSAAWCDARSPVVVVVANRLLLEDLDNSALKNISRMMREGGVGFVCPNCAGPKSEASVMMTAGAGVGCKGGKYSGEFFSTDETAPDGMSAGDSYGVRSGFHAKPGSLVFLGLGQALHDNSESSHTAATLGACGTALKSAGLTTCFIGNADVSGEIDRSAAALAMDGEGQITCGVPNAGYPKIGEPAGVLSDLTAIAKSIGANIGKSDLIVVSFGDVARIDELGIELDESIAKRRKAAALRNLDLLIGYLMAGRSKIQLILVSFSPPQEGVWNRPTPIVMWPALKPGLLTSASTRTPGFVAASDFAPTVIGLLQAKSPGEVVGRPIQEIAAPGSKLAALREEGKRVTANELMLAPVFLSIAFLGAMMFTVISLFTAFSRDMSARAARRMRIGLLVAGSSPLAMLLAVFAPAGVAGYVGATVVLAVVSMAVSLLLGPILTRIGWRFGYLMAIYAMTSAAVIADAFNGCPLGKFALLGAYQITSMRFYGIGNEYAGLIISMVACFCLFAPKKLRAKLVLILGALLIFTFGIGSFGANYGATVATAVTFGLLWFSVKRSSFGLRHVALAFVAAVAIVFAFAILDYKLAGSAASHAGRATGLIQKMGGEYIFALVSRKVLLNLKLVTGKHAFWVFSAFVPFLALWFRNVQGKIMSQFKADRAIVTGLKAIMIGSAAGFVFNDSGLVMAAIMVCMTFLVLIYSLLGKWVGECQE